MEKKPKCHKKFPNRGKKDPKYSEKYPENAYLYRILGFG
jgi:hypothetical protein